MKQLQLRNKQRTRSINAKSLRAITAYLLERLLELENYELGIHLVSARKMAEVNERFLQHEGSTDVISFDYREGYDDASIIRPEMRGEIFISVEDAVKQARQFRTSWPQELVRYIVHGALHLLGYDDLEPAKRRVMKRKENQLMKRLNRQCPIQRIAA